MKLAPQTVLIGVLAAGVATAHVMFKRDLDSDTIRQMASTLHSQRGWLGKIAPNSEVTLREGEHFELADYVGKKVIVINFFATWCAPCRKEMPEFDRFYTLYTCAIVTLFYLLALVVLKRKSLG